MLVTVPYKPRPQQKAIHAALGWSPFVVAVCHRRMGKTVAAVNHLIRAAATCTKPDPRFAYIGPTYTQSKRNMWTYLLRFTAPIPGIVVNHSELYVELPNRARISVYGSDNIAA